MTESTRIPRAEITGLYGSVLKKMSKKMFGQVPDALTMLWHNKPVLKLSMGMSKSGKWKECDQSLKSFAHMATVGMVGCSFCLDLGYFQAHNEGLDLEKAREVPRWRESEVFTPLERDAMEYAEAMTVTPPTVSDALSARLLEQIGPAALVELTAFISLANQASRMNVAIGAEAAGLAESCNLKPLAAPGSVASQS